MSNKYDVIIIGAGIGGLTCDTKLAKEGLKVLIIEKHDKVGGCVTACRKKGFNFDYGAHIFGSCNKNGILKYYLNELRVNAIDFVRLNPTERFIFPDQTIGVPQSIDEYMDFLKNKYPDEAGKIEPFFSEVIKIARSFSSETLLRRYKEMTFEQLLWRYFKNVHLMSILSAQFRYLGSTPVHLAATSTCLMMVSYLRDGTYYPRGGTQKFSDSIADKFKEYGGKTLLKNEAMKIIVKNKRVLGVKTKNGGTYESDIVISNGDAAKTFFSLIDRTEISQTYLETIKKMRISSSFFMTFLGVKNDLELKNKNGWYHYSYGLDLKPDQSMYIFIPSLVDDSAAAKNHHVIELAMPFPYDFNNVKDWSSCKQELKDKLLNMATKVIPGLRRSIEFEESATPKTIERYTYNAHGAACGWEMSVDQVHNKRLAHKTPITGLYLVGHWTNPGCGVAPVATSGWIVADQIIKERCHQYHEVKT